jgi:hypothetical protein
MGFPPCSAVFEFIFHLFKMFSSLSRIITQHILLLYFCCLNWFGLQLSGAEAKIHVRPRPDAKESVIEIAGSPKHSHTAPSPGNG